MHTASAPRSTYAQRATGPCWHSEAWLLAPGTSCVYTERFRLRCFIDTNALNGSLSRLVCRTTYITRVQQTRQFMDVMNNPEKKAEAEQFFRSRVETQPPPRDDSA